MTTSVIYIVSDGKPGHLAQSRGLAQAIARRIAVQIKEVMPETELTPDELSGVGDSLVMGAGRKTYKRVLALAEQTGSPAVALMNPGWWHRRRFELCVIPRHDGVAPSEKVVLTEGALNGITPAASASLSEGLLLIGGPSKHHGWDDAAIRQQLTTLLQREPSIRWTATSSRRTPDSTERALHAMAAEVGERFVFTPAVQTPPGWVARQLQRCGVCWVSEDSVSMVYEALTAGARVGLLDVPRRSGKPGRVVRGVVSLVERGWVVPFDQWQQGEALPADRPPLSEADRVASLIIERWLKATTPSD